MRFSIPAAFAIALALVSAPVTAQTAAPGAAPKPAASSPAKAAAPAASPAAHATPIDINSATKDELDGLPQIGAARAEAIIKGRPYRAKSDLVEKKIVPQNVYNGIKDRIVAHQKS
jgi:DNA uptake protein ComE-like DNA-binding protein